MTISKIDEAGLGIQAYGNRRLNLNGAMNVAQRGTSVAAGTSTYLVDQFFTTNTGTSALTYSQEDDAPDGFSKSAKVTVGTAQALQADDYTQFTTHLEGYNIAHLNFGTSAAQTVTLSFWVKSSLTGSFGLTFANGDVDQNYITSYTISTADTWEKKTITLAGATAGTWNAANARELSIYWDLGIGTTYSTATQNSWLTSFVFGLTDAVKLKETVNATWQITGVQLEAGSVATPFEHRSFADELQRCQRYFYSSYNTGVAIGSGTSNGAIAMRNGANDNVIMTTNLPTELRTSGTLTTYSPQTGASGKIRNRNNNTDVAGARLASGTKNVAFYGGSITDQNDWMEAHITVEAEL